MIPENPLIVGVDGMAAEVLTNGAASSRTASRLSSDWFSGDLLETLPAAVYVCNAEGIVVAYNLRASALWGRSSLAGRHRREILRFA